jgi:hypothetical protein
LCFVQLNARAFNPYHKAWAVDVRLKLDSKVSPELVFGSVVTRNYLRFARAMRQTVHDHHPSVPHYVLLLDALSGEALPESVAGETYVPFDAIVTDANEQRRLTFRYDPLELSCAMKPLLASYLIRETRAASVAYFDCDMTLHAPLPAAALPADSRSIVLTPHWIHGDAPGVEAIYLKFGAFNAGFFSVRNDEHGQAFLDFWWERCRRFCMTDLSEGLFADQTWLNLAPIVFNGSLSVCAHTGMNVSWWNLHERLIRCDQGQIVTAANQPLVLFHWSQVGENGPIFCEESALDPVCVTTVRALHRQFAALVATCTSSEDRHQYRYATFPDGSPILEADRAAYRHHGDAIEGDASANPFEEVRWFKSRRARRKLKRVASWIMGPDAATAIAALARSDHSLIR